MKTDTSERGLEALIVAHMTSSGWIAGNPAEYDRAYAVDLVQLQEFIKATQKLLVEAFDLALQPVTAEVPGPAPGRDRQTRRHRRAAARHQARPA